MSLLPSRGPETSTAQEGELQVVGVDEEVAPIFDALASDTARDVLNAIYEDPGTPSEIADRLDMSIQKVSYHLENLEDVDLISIAGTRYSEKGQEMKVYEPPEEPMVLFVGTEDRKRTLRSLVKRVVPTLGILAVASAAVQSAFGGGLNIGFGGSDGSEPRAVDVTENGGQDAGDELHAADTEGAGAAGGDDVGIQSDGTGAPTEPNAVTGTDAATGTPQMTPAETGTPTSAESTPAPEATGTPTYEARATETAEPGGDVGFTGATNETARTPTEMMEEAGQGADGALDAAAALEPGVAFFLGGLFVLAVVGTVWYVRTR